MFDNKWQKKEMPLVSLIGMGGGIASPAFLASIVLNILKPTVFSPADDTGVPDFDYTAESSAITNINQIAGGWSSTSFDSNGANNQWQSVAYGNGKYVALGKIGNAYLAANSTDGINWTSYNTIPYTSYSHLAYGNGAFVAVGQNKIVYSTDEGESWSSASVSTNWWKGVTYGGGKFVAVAEDGTNRVATSSDGVNWSETSAPGNTMWQAVTYGGGKFVAVSQMGDVMYSSNGTNWSTTSATESAVWNSVVYGNGKFVAVAGPKTMYSTDGINWFSGNNTVGYWKDITFGDGRFVAVSNYQDSSYPAAAGYSTDGGTWTSSSQAISGEWNGVDYVNGRFIAVAGLGTPKIMWSPTGVDEATQLTLTDTTVSKVSDGTLISGTTIDQVLTVGETVQADTAVSSTVTVPVFSTTTYSYTSTPQTIANGIDLAGEGGLIWTKWRSGGAYSTESHCLIDTERSSGSSTDQYGTLTPYLRSDQTSGQTNANLINFNSDGYEITSPSSLLNHDSGGEYVSWTFRKTPGFFDIVTYTGDGVIGRTIPHNLGSVPGMIMIKATGLNTNWRVHHRSQGGTKVSILNNTTGFFSDTQFNNTLPTSTVFSVDRDSDVNAHGHSYVAYVFAEDIPGLIKCGSYTGAGVGTSVDVGFRPSWVLIKSSSNSSTNWVIADSSRPNEVLWPNSSDAAYPHTVSFNASGFSLDSNSSYLNLSGYEYIYMAIAEDAETDITSDIYASGTVSASSGNTITLSNTTGTWSTGMKIQGTDSDTKDNPDPILAENVSLTSSAPTAERNVSTWGDAVWEIATDENFTQNVQTATTALSATGTQAGPSFTLEPNTGYYTRTKYTALGQESEWSDVTYFVTSQNVYVDDVFSTTLWTGDSQDNREVNTGIDNTDKSLMWIKVRNETYGNLLTSPSFGAGYHLLLDQELGQLGIQGHSGAVKSFNNDGINVGTYGYVNVTGKNYAGWNFKAAPGFFDVVTYTGNGGSTGGAGDDGSNSRDVPHNLGTTPGMILVKCLDNSGSWFVWHRDYQNTTTDWMSINTSGGVNSHSNMWGAINASSFGVTNRQDLNNDGLNYIAYIFAHDDARFGTNSDESIIKCGSVTTNSSGEIPDVNLGFEPQFLLIKRSDSSGHWYLYDSMRGMPVGSNESTLYANLNNAEVVGANTVELTSTGFKGGPDSLTGATGNLIYMAIRRPHKPPTAGTQVFAVATASNYSNGDAIPCTFAPDFFITTQRTNTQVNYAEARLTDLSMELNSTSSEDTGNYFGFDGPGGKINLNVNYGQNPIYWQFRRAPGFFDVVTADYPGSGAAIPHNLGVAPELIISKPRNGSVGWMVGSDYLQNTNGWNRYFELNSSGSEGGTSVVWNQTAPTATHFTLGTYPGSSYKGVFFLFATLSDISKVGSYTGTGSDINVDCGFTAGARFVLIKRTDSTGDWYIWDTTRGITSGNDPYLLLNSTAAQVTNTDYIDSLNAGFTVTSSAPAALNASGGEYLFLAIA